MISLKRNSKGELVEAPGVRTRAGSVYTPGQSTPFRVSRGKFYDFLMCRRCFYLDRVKGLVSPSTPGWSLNDTVDRLLKKEFDICREAQKPHRVFEKYGLSDVVPFQHEKMDQWRDSLHHGLEHQVAGTNVVLHGGVDDIWYHQADRQLIVADYKAQASSYPVYPRAYLEHTFHQAYKVQLDVYAYLLTNMGFPVWPTAYFYVCNADRNAAAFDGQLAFKETLVPYRWDPGWIKEKVLEMAQLLDSPGVPASNPSCENCAYARARSGIL